MRSFLALALLLQCPARAADFLGRGYPRLEIRYVSQYKINFVYAKDAETTETLGNEPLSRADLRALARVPPGHFVGAWRSDKMYRMWKVSALIWLILGAYYGLEKTIYAEGFAPGDFAVLAIGAGSTGALWSFMTLLLDYWQTGVLRDYEAIKRAVFEIRPASSEELDALVNDLRRALKHVRHGDYISCLRALR